MTTLRTRAAALLAAVEPMTKGPWYAPGPDDDVTTWFAPVDSHASRTDAACVVRLHNDAPAIIRDLLAALDASEAECERVRRVAEEAVSDLDAARAEIDAGHSHRRTVARMKLAAATERLRAALKEPPR